MPKRTSTELDDSELVQNSDYWILRKYGNFMMAVGAWFIRRGMWYADMYVYKPSGTPEMPGGMYVQDVYLDD